MSMKPKNFILLFGVILIVLGGGFLGYLLLHDINVTPREWILYSGVLFALVGWVVTAYVSLHNSMKQHTINILLQSRLSPRFKEEVEKVLKEYPDMPNLKAVSQEDLNNEEKQEALNGLRYLLNYYEFIAVGIKQGDLDEKLLKNCVRGIVCDLYAKSEVFIRYLRGDNQRGHIEHPKAYEHLIKLRNRWKN